jgi:hypothetical protein
LSACLALTVSNLPAGWKDLAGDSIWTMFVIAFALALLNLTGSLTEFYCRKYDFPRNTAVFTRNVLRIAVLIIGCW